MSKYICNSITIFQFKTILGAKSAELQSWQFQPTHNIYYLVASELGLIGLFVYLMIIFNIIQHNLKKIVSRETILTHSLSEKIKNTSQHLKNFEVLKKIEIDRLETDQDKKNEIVSRETIFKFY